MGTSFRRPPPIQPNRARLNAIPVLSEYRDHLNDFYLLRFG
jgi:hypothetical protein